MNDVDFPVATVLEGIDAADAAGLGADQDQRRREARRERPHRRRPGAALPRSGAHPALHRVHGRRRDATAGGWTTWCPARRSCETISARTAAGAAGAELPRRGGAALALPRRRRRDRRHHLGHAAVLRRLHARAPLRRGPALHLPLRRPRAPTSARRCAVGGSDDGDRRAAPRGRVARCATTATRSCDRRRRSEPAPASRCRTSGADAMTAHDALRDCVGTLSHLDAEGHATHGRRLREGRDAREATARGRVVMRRETLALIVDGALPKGDVLAVARIAGIMAAKRTHDLIPLCHPLPHLRRRGRADARRSASPAHRDRGDRAHDRRRPASRWRR